MFIPDQTFFHPKSRIRTVSIPDTHQKKQQIGSCSHQIAKT
jgi:hypothetical protein